ncbi:MAG TPA: hypothetical protein VFS43_21740, partial [Polyangiaceae bacterium]|nr:hypothetical protein [Polyangiaceae bacterium]
MKPEKLKKLGALAGCEVGGVFGNPRLARAVAGDLMARIRLRADLFAEAVRIGEGERAPEEQMRPLREKRDETAAALAEALALVEGE